jgi:hypothetical protein
MFFEPFLAHLASKFEKRMYKYDKKIIFLIKIKKIIKKRKISWAIAQ